MSIGMVALVIVTVLTLFGVSSRVFDGMYLSDKGALMFIAAMFVLGLVPEVPLGDHIKINLGGSVVPVALCVYLFVRAGTAKERWRTVAAVVITTAVVYALGVWMPNEPEQIVLDPNYAYAIAAAVVAYALGRSRRGAFIAAVMGVLLADVVNAVVLAAQGIAYDLNLGGGGYFDVVVLSGIGAVVLAELFGELMERIVKRRENKRREGGAA